MFDSHQAIAVYRGWQALERTLPDGAEVIDFDVVTDIEGEEHLDTREQVLQRLRHPRDSVQVAAEQAEFLRAKLNASLFYLRCLMGERFEFYQHVRTMLGISPELVEEATIVRQEQKLFSLLAAAGVPLRDGRPAAEHFQVFTESIQLSRD